MISRYVDPFDTSATGSPEPTACGSDTGTPSPFTRRDRMFEELCQTTR
ncbi:MAG: hypothetical protein AABO58_17925 [Acidobacteriota bacterium]